MAHLLLGTNLLSRRGLLRNTALMTVLAPVLRRRDAHGAPAPRRVIFVYSGNGPIVTLGPASGTETAFQLHDWWKPLERHRAEGIFFSHLAVTGSGVVSGGGHGLGGQIFSGFGAGANGNQYAAKGESVDQIAAKHGVATAPTQDSGDSGPAHHPWTHNRAAPEETDALRIFTTFETGRYLRSSTDDRGGGSGRVEAGKDMARILVSAIQYMGLKDIDTVGATGVKGRLMSLYA